MPNSPLAAELRDAITPRAFFLMVGVLLVQLGFLLSYLGAFHHPEPHRIPLAVAGPQQFADRLDGLSGEPVETTVVPDERAARERVMRREADGAYLLGPRGGRSGGQDGEQDTLLIATGGGTAVADALTEVGERIAEQRGRKLRTIDIAPTGEDDRGSLSAFYLVIGWLVGGYLGAAMLGVTAGARPASPRRAGFRLAAMACYAVLSGLGGALIADPLLGALPGHFAQLWGIGAVAVFAAGAVTIGLQVLFGVFGIGLAIVLFVVLGNPSAGGAYQPALLPAFWRAIGPWLPTGAGTTAVRNTVYFHGNALAGPLWTLGIWALAGVLCTLAFSTRRPTEDLPGLSGFPAVRGLPQ